MADFDNEHDKAFFKDKLEKKNQLFTGILDSYPSEDEISIMNIRRITGDRVLEKLVLTGDIRELVEDKYNPEDDFRNIAFVADIELKNIRIVGCEKMTTKETRDMFSAIFDGYDNELAGSIKLKEVRTRFGGVVKENLTFEEAKVENFPATLGEGDYTAFIADLKFERVKFLDMFGVR